MKDKNELLNSKEKHTFDFKCRIAQREKMYKKYNRFNFKYYF